MIKSHFSVLFAIFLSLILNRSLYPNAENYPVLSEASPRFSLDVSYFRGFNEFTQIELYYSVPSSELTFNTISNEILSSVSLSLVIKDSDDNIVFNTTKKKKLRVKSYEDTKDIKNGLIDQIVIDLLPGVYNLDMKITDDYSNSESNISNPLKLKAFKNTLDVSTIQLASFISPNDKNNNFNKGNKLVLPNPSSRYALKTSFLYLYYEIYNLIASDIDSQSVFRSNILVYNQFGDSLIATEGEPVVFRGTSCIQTSNLDIRELEPGNYWVSVLIIDISNGQQVKGENKFTIYNPTSVEESLPMTEEDIIKYRDQIKYFASQNELDLYDELNNNGKRNFLINFWRARDYTPDTPENEFMKDCFARIDYANKNFKNGLNSDMGRVFIIYGQPDEIENRPMNMNTKPYAIWDYFSTRTGKQQFIFVDKTGNHNYTLVHSTVETEIKNYNWMIEEVQN